MRPPQTLRGFFANGRLANKAKTTVTDLSQGASDYVKKKASEGSDAVKSAVTQAAAKASDAASNLAQGTSEFVTRKVSEGSIAVKKATTERVTAASDAIYRLPRESSLYVKKKVLEGTNAASNAAAETVASASSTASQKFQSSFGDIPSTRDRALSWLWWWSLAAIAVYGVATTVPKELIRQYAAKSIEKKSEEDEQP